jgi:hypothetical protein
MKIAAVQPCTAAIPQVGQHNRRSRKAAGPWVGPPLGHVLGIGQSARRLESIGEQRQECLLRAAAAFGQRGQNGQEQATGGPLASGREPQGTAVVTRLARCPGRGRRLVFFPDRRPTLGGDCRGTRACRGPRGRRRAHVMSSVRIAGATCHAGSGADLAAFCRPIGDIGAGTKQDGSGARPESDRQPSTGKSTHQVH